ncbi:MAG: alpha/beta hydrolase [candidate division Zixibacteria bacterium]|nr:alpha/beta hydrolase [candidate division Zixibacteria bacterium]
MGRLSLKERIAYRFVFNEKRVYRHWYTRFLICGIDLDRIQRVVARVRNFYTWCSEWSKEGELLQSLAEEALSRGNVYSARCLFQEAAGCFHIGQHLYFIDIEQKNKAQERARENYRKAIALFDEKQRPLRLEIPFRKTVIPGYLRLTDQPNRPLIIQINGLDNIKEVENHSLGNFLLDAGFNSFAFDGPGQGEMWKDLKLIPDYEKAVSTILDWFEDNSKYDLDLTRVGTFGMSFGGYLSPRAAAYDRRISCAVGNGGPGYLPDPSRLKSINPIWISDLLHVMGYENMRQAQMNWGLYDIRKAPPLDRPLLFIQGGKDRIIPNPREHADYIMNWAVGEKELKYFPEGEHCCANFLDEVIPYCLDWLRRHLLT